MLSRLQKMNIILYASFIISYFAFVHSAGNYNALIFDRYERSLIKLPNEIPNGTKSGQWATACPAGSNEEEQETYNKNKSLYKNALFVRNIYKEEVLSATFKEKEICNKPFKLSIAVSTERIPINYEFGYEVNFELFEAENFTASDGGKYIPIEDTLTRATPAEFLETRPALLKAIGKKYQEKRFIWIPLFKVISTKKQLRRIEYEIHQNNIQPFVKCKDYNLGKEYFEGVNTDEFYSLEVQKKAFTSVNIPEAANEACKTSFNCFEKASLIPADQFQFNSNEPPNCSNMTTIPIWSSVVTSVLKKVDTYLYTLSQISGRPLHITAGVHKNLQYLTRRMKQKKFIILKRQPSNLQISKIIYKMVTLKSNETCKNEDAACRKGILIVIHNYPDFKVEHRICKDKSEELGWDEVMYPNLSTGEAKSENIYICSIEEDTISKIGLKYNEKLLVGELSLKNFPGIAVEDKNMKTQVFDELKRLAEGGELKIENNLIRRPFINNDDIILESTETVENVDRRIEDEETEEDDDEENTKEEGEVRYSNSENEEDEEDDDDSFNR